jgi:hypothetical protein
VDDILILSNSKERCRSETHFLRSLLRRLGWIVREDKSTQVPDHRVIFLGFLIDSKSMTVTLPPRKAHTIVHDLRRFARQATSSKHPRRRVARIAGLVNSVAQALPIAHALVRHLLMDLKQSPGPWNSSITVSKQAIDDLLLLSDLLSNLTPLSLIPPTPSLHFRSDASLEGWGAHCVTTGREAKGQWCQSGMDLQSINKLEMLAAFETLKSFQPPPGSVVLLEMDNTTAVVYLTKFAGRVPSLFHLSREILAWCQAHQVTLQTRYLPGRLNTEADSLSRINKDWEISQEAFLKICQSLQCSPTIDRFASPSNAKLHRFNSRLFHQDAVAPNALAQDWTSETNYWAPPLPLLQSTISKLTRERAQGILITPNWVGRWLPDVLQNASTVVLVPPSAVKSIGMPFETSSEGFLAWKFSAITYSTNSPRETETWWSRVKALNPWELSSKL